MTATTHSHDERKRVAAVERKRGGKDNPPTGGPRHGNAGKSAKPTAATLFSVYAGRDRLGAYCRDGETFTAFTRLGRPIGIFDSEQAAIAAIDPPEAP
jgi:hypothetical protein